MRIARPILWTSCGQQKNWKKYRRRPCAIPGRGSRNAFTVRNGHCPGASSGDAGGAGQPQPDAGAWLWRAARGAGKARRLADLMRRGQARSPASHTWRGPCRIPTGTSAWPGTRTRAGRAGPPAPRGPHRGLAGFPAATRLTFRPSRGSPDRDDDIVTHRTATMPHRVGRGWGTVGRAGGRGPGAGGRGPGAGGQGTREARGDGVRRARLPGGRPCPRTSTRTGSWRGSGGAPGRARAPRARGPARR